jgi:hypothetical protein
MIRESSVAIDTVPLPERVVRVAIPAKVAFDLGNMQKVTQSILGRLGCPSCHSGWDIRFRMSLDFLVNDKLEIREGMEGGVIIHG